LTGRDSDTFLNDCSIFFIIRGAVWTLDGAFMEIESFEVNDGRGVLIDYFRFVSVDNPVYLRFVGLSISSWSIILIIIKIVLVSIKS